MSSLPLPPKSPQSPANEREEDDGEEEKHQPQQQQQQPQPLFDHHDGPLVVFDVETTGLDRTARIVCIAAIKYVCNPVTGASEEVASLRFDVNPGVHIPAEATAVHGITDGMVNRPGVSRFGDAMAADIIAFFQGARYVVGYNVSFDLRILGEHMHSLSRLGREWARLSSGLRVIDVMKLVFRAHPRSLGSMALLYGLMSKRELSGLHDATFDARTTHRLLCALANNPTGVPQARDIPASAHLSADASCPAAVQGDLCGDFQVLPRPKRGYADRPGSSVALTFGKHKGVPLSRVPQSYLGWLARTNSSAAAVLGSLGVRF